MCNFFSAIIDKNYKVYWKRGVDSHSDLVELFKLKEPSFDGPPKTNREVAEKMKWAKVEIVPKDKDYLLGPDKKNWEFFVDEEISPPWWNKSYEKPVWGAFKEGVKIYDEFNWKEAKNPIHPFKIKPPVKITKKHLDLLEEWASVRASVWESVWESVRASVCASVRDSVCASVRDSVRDSVWESVWESVRASVCASVRDSVRASVWESVWAYIDSLFTGIDTWKYVDLRKKPFNAIKGYSFRSAEKLWRMGLVPSFGGKLWRLHGGSKGEVLWEEEI
jgi:hypothetical protein